MTIGLTWASGKPEHVGISPSTVPSNRREQGFVASARARHRRPARCRKSVPSVESGSRHSDVHISKIATIRSAAQPRPYPVSGATTSRSSNEGCPDSTTVGGMTHTAVEDCEHIGLSVGGTGMGHADLHAMAVRPDFVLLETAGQRVCHTRAEVKMPLSPADALESDLKYPGSRLAPNRQPTTQALPTSDIAPPLRLVSNGYQLSKSPKCAEGSDLDLPI